MCLIYDHQAHNHEVVDLQQVQNEKYEALILKINSLEEDLRIKREKVVAAEEDVKQKSLIGLMEIKNNRRKHFRILNKQYDKLIDGISNKSAEVIGRINREIAVIDETTFMLHNIKQVTEGRNTSHAEIARKHQTLKEMQSGININFVNSKSYEH